MRKNPISKQEIEIIGTIIKDIKSGKLIINHPLQRYSDMWSKEQQGNLIRRVLHDGRFLPILICTQYDEYGCEVRYLIDGVQRMTTFENFINDGFAISKNVIDYIVEYDGIVYTKKDTSSGKFSLKRDRDKNLIPILDENGNTQRRVQSIDIRGLRFSDLPPELQDKIKNYKVSIEMKLECSDEDIQIEILDYNSGTKMNDAQIGKNRLGTELARQVTEITNHSFIKNKCGFTVDNRKKGIIDRAVNEALMLVSFGVGEWTSSHKDLCRKLARWLNNEHITNLTEMLDELDNIIPELKLDNPEDKEILDYLTLKEFFVVMANYKHFRDCGYKNECYADFLREFITETSYIKSIPTGEIDENNDEVYDSFRNIFMQGSKQKANIQSRLETMNQMLDDYLKENCADMIDNGKDKECDFVISENAPMELQEYAQNFVDDEQAIECLMLTTNSPYANYSNQALNQTVEWYKRNGTADMLNDCLFYKQIAIDGGVNEGDVDLPIYIYAIKYIEDNNIPMDTEAWVKQFRKKAFEDINCDKGNLFRSSDTIALKIAEVIKDIKNTAKEV